MAAFPSLYYIFSLTATPSNYSSPSPTNILFAKSGNEKPPASTSSPSSSPDILPASKAISLLFHLSLLPRDKIIPATMPNGLQQLIIARAEGGTRPKTRRIANNVVLMHLPPGYEMNNKLKLNSSLLPGFGELSVLYIDDPRHATELIELVRLRAASPLVNSIPPKRRETPLPPHNEHPGNIKYIGDFLDKEEEAQASQYRHVMSRIHEVIITGLLKYVSSDTSTDRSRVLAYLQNLGRASPVWEERAKELLLEEHQVLQDMIKEIYGGWALLQHFLSSNMITAAQWECLVITAMVETVRKSPILRDYHMVVYDVSIDHFVHGKVGETLLTSLDAWMCPIDVITGDSFRINSPFMTSRKHPMQRLDELGEKFFRKLTNTYQSGETLYTRAVFCRSLLTTYFFQSFITVWDECILNGHLQGLRGLAPVYPKIIDRLRDRMAHGSCPRESHLGFRNSTKKLTQGEDESISRIVHSRGSRILIVQASVSEDVEMVDAGPLSDNSSDTVIQQEKSRPTEAAVVSKREDKRRKRREKRKQTRRATLITIERSKHRSRLCFDTHRVNIRTLCEEPIQGTPNAKGPQITRIERPEIPSKAPVDNKVIDASSALSQMANETPSAEVVTPKDVANWQTRSIIDDLIIGRAEVRSNQLEPIIDASKSGMEVSEEAEKLPLPEVSVGGQNHIKNRAKKDRRRARAVNVAALQQTEQPSPVVEQDAVVNPPPRKNIVLDLPSQSVEELTKPVPQKREIKMPRRRKTIAQVAPCTVPGAAVAEPAVQQDKPAAAKNSDDKSTASKSRASTPSEPDTDLYDDPEAIAAAIKASEEEDSSWTKVGAKRHDIPQTHKFMEMRGLRSAGHGHIAVFPTKNVPSRPPSPHRKPNTKAPAVQGKPLPVQSQAKSGHAQSQGKATPPQGRMKVVSPQDRMKVAPLQSQMKTTPPQSQMKAVRNQVLPKPDVAKTSTPSKKPLPKRNQKPSGKPPRQKREARIPVIDSMKEFPTLATSTILLSHQKDGRSTGEWFMDMTVELASDEIKLAAPTHTATASTVDEAKASGGGSVKKKTQSVSAASPSRPVGPTKSQKGELSVVAQAVEPKKDTTAASKAAIEFVVEPLAVKSQVQDTKAKASIKESKETLVLPSSISPLAETSHQGTAPVTPTRALAKKERCALARKAAEEQKTQELSIKERAELRPSLESKKSPMSAGKTASTTQSAGIAHPGDPILTPTDAGAPEPSIIHEGRAVAEGGDDATVNDPKGVDSGIVTLPVDPRPREIELASGVHEGSKYKVVATEEAARILSGGQQRIAAPRASRLAAVPRMPGSAVGMEPSGATFALGVPMWNPIRYRYPVAPGGYFIPGGPRRVDPLPVWAMWPRALPWFGWPPRRWVWDPNGP